MAYLSLLFYRFVYSMDLNITKRSNDMIELEPLEMTIFSSSPDEVEPICSDLEKATAATVVVTKTRKDSVVT
jgi:hypothetical protein